MTVVRIAVYPVDVGQLDALKQSVDADLVPLYHQQPGFESLSIVTCGDDVVSVSRWDSHDHAEAGSRRRLSGRHMHQAAPGRLVPSISVRR